MSASNANSYTLKKNYLECSLCTKEWLNNSPKLLQCQHTFCKKCLLSLFKPKDESTFQCPICDKNTLWSQDKINGIADNLVPADLLLDTDDALEISSNFGICRKHKLRIIFYCQLCAVQFCVDCHENHKDHKIVTIKDINHNDFQRRCREILENIQCRIFATMNHAISDTVSLEDTLKDIVDCVKTKIASDIEVRYCQEIYRIDELKRKIASIDESDEMCVEARNEMLGELNLFVQDLQSKIANSNSKGIELNRKKGFEYANIFMDMFSECLSDRLSRVNYTEMVTRLESICTERDYELVKEFDKKERIVTFPSAGEITAICADHRSTGYTYVSVMSTGGTGKIYKIDENDRISVFQFFRKPIRSILSYKKELFVLLSDSMLRVSNFLSYEITVLAAIDDAVDACIGDSNSFIYITKNTIGKLIIGSDFRLISRCDLGPKENEDSANYKSICPLSNSRLAVLSETFKKGSCIWIYGQRTRDRSFADSLGKKAHEPIGPLQFVHPSGICSLKGKGMIIADKEAKRLHLFYGNYTKKPLIVSLNFHPEFVSYSEKTDEIFVSEEGTNRLHIFS
ncbi:unnamed protein product [Dimorphilus gyrociliatus]|uniref:Uncharacterized protein n=1 Tax=Dimorphilus gyrociliatus TaxID=2664684 RepID=A0A7I8W9R8_9ANNE|nr:unnamed protein product [Dimorphilus gyrociliatus]